MHLGNWATLVRASSRSAAPARAVERALSTGTSPENPDIFTSKLQQQTEQELLDLINKNPIVDAAGSQDEDEEGDESPVRGVWSRVRTRGVVLVARAEISGAWPRTARGAELRARYDRAFSLRGEEYIGCARCGRSCRARAGAGSCARQDAPSNAMPRERALPPCCCEPPHLPHFQVNKETGELGGPKGPEPTRFGDWSNSGRCVDF